MSGVDWGLGTSLLIDTNFVSVETACLAYTNATHETLELVIKNFGMK